MAYQWVEITQNFDKSLPFTKVRFDISDQVAAVWSALGDKIDGCMVETPYAMSDNWDGVLGSYNTAQYGYADQNRFTLASGYRHYCDHQGNITDHKIATYGTLISGTTYEVEYAGTVYWGGLPGSNFSNCYASGIGVSVYVESSSINVDATAITGTYKASSYTVNLSSMYDWTATTVPFWVTLSTTAGTSGDTSIVVSFGKNTSPSQRTGTIVFTNANNETAEVLCTQGESPLFLPNNNIYRGGLIIN